MKNTNNNLQINIYISLRSTCLGYFEKEKTSIEEYKEQSTKIILRLSSILGLFRIDFFLLKWHFDMALSPCYSRDKGYGLSIIWLLENHTLCELFLIWVTNISDISNLYFYHWWFNASGTALHTNTQSSVHRMFY